MTTLQALKREALKKEALEACRSRGHTMYRWHEFTPLRIITACVHCGEDVTIIVEPLPNETHIGGPAVAIDCAGWSGCHQWIRDEHGQTHRECSKKARNAMPCTAHDMTFGGRCIACGFTPGTQGSCRAARNRRSRRPH